MEKIDIEVRGSTGNVGVELLEILQSHPNVDHINCVRAEEEPGERAETSFLALPHGLSGEVAQHLVKAGKKVIDLSGDLRFEDPAQYEKWYENPHPAPDLLPVVYGLPEKNRDKISSSKVVSVPGCYPTATILGALPLLEKGLVEPASDISVVAFSGYSGAGKAHAQENDDAVLYSTGRTHRHVGEMEQFTGTRLVDFTAIRLDNIYRGLLSIGGYALREGVEDWEVTQALHEQYDDEPFVQILEGEEVPTHQTAANTDLCVIGHTINAGFSRRAVVISAIDNLRKGSATEAVQCFNLMQSFDETTGLTPKNEVF